MVTGRDSWMDRSAAMLTLRLSTASSNVEWIPACESLFRAVRKALFSASKGLSMEMSSSVWAALCWIFRSMQCSLKRKVFSREAISR